VLGAVLSLVVGILKITLPAPGTPPPNPQASFRGFQNLTLPGLQARLTEFDPSVADRDWYRHITGVRGAFGSVTLSTNLRQTAAAKRLANTACFNVWSTLIGDFTNVFVVVDDRGGLALATCSIDTVG